MSNHRNAPRGQLHEAARRTERPKMMRGLSCPESYFISSIFVRRRPEHPSSARQLLLASVAFAAATLTSGASFAQISADAFIPGANSSDLGVLATEPPFLGLIAPLGDGGMSPIAVAPSHDGTSVFVLLGGQGGNGSIAIVDSVTGKVKSTSPLPLSTVPTGLALSPDGTTLFVANSGSNDVTPVNAVTGMALTNSLGFAVRIPVGAAPAGLAFLPNGKTLYVVNSLDNTVCVIDAATDVVTGNFVVGMHPVGAAVTPDGSKLFVVNQFGGTVSVIATATNTVVNTISVGAQPAGIAITPDGRHAYVINIGNGTLSVIDTATNLVVGTPIPVPIGSTPAGATASVGITPDGKFLFVVAPGSNTPGSNVISVFSTATNTLIETLSSPQNLATMALPGEGFFASAQFIGPNIIVAAGGPLRIGSDAALTPLGFGQFVVFNGGTWRRPQISSFRAPSPSSPKAGRSTAAASA